MTRTDPGSNSTKRVIHFGQGLSVDFSFSCVKSKTRVNERTMLVLMARLVGFLLPTTILVCNMVRFVKAKLPLLNGYVNGCKYIVIL
mmetsp:Transcript_31920/g.35558  ORF Transcript_31920/g.35558 Transcript_31920/m.35558 type:complete len:87 (-) Transcript_31920:1507-1767(-)